MRDEPGIAAEAAPRPLPYAPHRLEHRRLPPRRTVAGGRAGEGGRPLPLRLARQARLVGGGVGLGLIPADVARWRLRVACGDRVMLADAMLLLPGPALLRPPLGALVASRLAELDPAVSAHRLPCDLERRQLDGVARALVVIGEA